MNLIVDYEASRVGGGIGTFSTRGSSGCWP
jgi:hypothetical protein